MAKKNEQLITINIMDRSGHRVEKVGFEGACDIIQEEMGAGRWLRVVDDGGESHLETEFAELSSDMDKMRKYLLSAKSLTLITALQGGGNCCGKGDLIEIDGKFYSRDKVKVKFEGTAEVLSAEGNKCAPAKKTAPKVETIDVVLISDLDEPVMSVTEDLVIFNNAFGLEAAADAIARFGAAVEKKWPEMARGEMEVVQVVSD